MDIRRKSYQQTKPTLLSSKAVRDLQKVFFLDYGIRITPQEAQARGLPFLKLMKHILKPIPNTNANKDYGNK